MLFRKTLVLKWYWVLFYVALFLPVSSSVSAQKAAKYPSAERVINDYLKAAGGKKRLESVKDAVYEWSYINGNSENSLPETRKKARMRMLQPAAWRFDVQPEDSFGNSEIFITAATTGNSVWNRQAAGNLQTLADAEANALRLQAALAASRLTDLKTQRIAARTVGMEKVGNETTYVVEFAMRNGAKIRYFFDANNKLPLKIENAVFGKSFCFGDYRKVNGIFEAHQMTEPCAAGESAANSRVYQLEKITYNANLKLSDFDPPRNEENFDVAAFLRELNRNQDEIERRVSEYTYVEKQTDREYNDKGEMTKETVCVYEVFPVAGSRRAVSKLISENGALLSPERLEKENRRVTEELEEIERKKERQNERRENNQKSGEEAAERRTNISFFLRASEVISPRREQFRGREVVVVDFRPRDNYKPQNRIETVFSKLVGTAWIDPQEKRIIRMEMRFPESFKAFGGMAKLKSGSAFVFEQTRMDDGVWLPKFAQVNASVKAFLVGGFNFNVTREFSEYRKFASETRDYKLDSPEEKKP